MTKTPGKRALVLRLKAHLPEGKVLTEKEMRELPSSLDCSPDYVNLWNINILQTPEELTEFYFRPGFTGLFGLA